MSQQIKILRKMIIYLVALWTLIVSVFLANNLWLKYNHANNGAINEAKLSLKKDLAFRTWVASHGGVYVPITKETPPNPYLSHIPKRNIQTIDKDNFTLMNPAYALAELMRNNANAYGSKNKITSTILLNPNNAPDKWEKKALKIIEQSRQIFYEKQTIKNQEYIRLLKPFVTEEACLKCHGFQGYKLGDIRGGISVSINIEPYYEEALNEIKPIVIQFITLWLIGLIGLWFTHKRLKLYINDKIRAYEENIYALVDMIEERDSYTAGHSKRVAHYCVLIAKEMGIDNDNLDLLRRAAMLHDIGKISTPDSILLKPSRLNKLEYDIIQEHVSSGYELLRKIDFYGELSEVMRHHHEHYDGSGYPNGLKNEEIPLLSQIMSVADAFDAMTTNRIYKGRKELDEALEELQELSGKQFHPKIAYAATKALSNINIQNDINQVPKTKLEKERFSYFYKDHLTQAHNPEYLKFILSKNKDEAFLYKYILSIALHNFSNYNKISGWENGNKKLIELSETLQSTFPDDLLFRIQGDDFLLISRNSIDQKIVQESLYPHFVNSCITLQYKTLDIDALNLKNLEELF